MSTQAVTVAPEAPRAARQMIAVQDPIPVLDTARFEHMQRVAKIMASCSLIPDCFYKFKVGDKEDFHPPETVMANCFLVVNQSVRWGMDPFAVAQCASVVKGKLLFEGKLVAAVLESKLGIRLDYTYLEASGDALGIIVSGVRPGETEARCVKGIVAEWKTNGSGSPWGSASGARRQLIYRGTREWARIWAPALMLGVYTDDEMVDLSDEYRARRAQVVGSNVVELAPPPPPPAPAARPSAPPANKFPPPPPPPPPAPAPVKEADVFDRFRADLKEFGHSQEESDAVYTQFVEANAGLTDDDKTELDAILHEHCEQFWKAEQ